jgi:hypothetical protein
VYFHGSPVRTNVKASRTVGKLRLFAANETPDNDRAQDFQHNDFREAFDIE